MFQPNYGIGNTKNNLEGLLKRCTSSNIWRLMNSDVAAQRRNLGVAIIFGIFSENQSGLAQIEVFIAMFWKWIFALCSLFLTTIIFFRSFYDMQVRQCAVAPPPGSTENATEKLMSVHQNQPAPWPALCRTPSSCIRLHFLKDKGCQAADPLDYDWKHLPPHFYVS